LITFNWIEFTERTIFDTKEDILFGPVRKNMEVLELVPDVTFPTKSKPGVAHRFLPHCALACELDPE
jgi:hypothetical protein